MCNTRPKRDDNAGSFMSGRHGKMWLHRPIAVSRVQICVADATRDDFHQGLPRPRCMHRKLSHHEWLAEFFDDCCAHHVRDRHTLFSLDLWSISSNWRSVVTLSPDHET